ncbi:MAG: hypothetical protein HOO96_15805 [Polyangiaceae bacterium]|nr:hypothetical protein [Polyangiaceae bacterium]
MASAVVFACLLVACGKTAEEPARVTEPRSGERLKLTWWQAPDGTRLVRDAFYDAILQEDCSPPDGWNDADQQPCVPTAGRSYVLEEYADSTCSGPPLLAPMADGGPVRYGVARVECSYRAFEATTVIGTARHFRRDADGRCAEAQGDPKAFLAQAVPEGKFARLTLTEGSGAERLQEVRVSSADGMVVPLARYVQDQLLGSLTVTDARLGSTDAPGLLPLNIVVEGYADAACSTRAASTGGQPPARCRHLPAVAIHNYYCGMGPLSRVGEATASGPTYLRQEGGRCSKWGDEGPRFEVGETVATAHLRSATDATQGRFRPVRWTGDQGFTTQPTLLYDAEQDVTCEPRTGKDGGGACVPTARDNFAWSVESAFADAACSQPVAFPRYYLGCTNYPQFREGDVFLEPIGDAATARTFNMRSVGPVTRQVFRRELSKCVPAPEEYEYHQPGAVLRAVSSPALTVVRGP